MALGCPWGVLREGTRSLREMLDRKELAGAWGEAVLVSPGGLSPAVPTRGWPWGPILGAAAHPPQEPGCLVRG